MNISKKHKATMTFVSKWITKKYAANRQLSSFQDYVPRVPAYALCPWLIKKAVPASPHLNINHVVQ